jgi:NAD(P)-dependent dehydrogenase (short-subunit alcohol dehydrogenase family)
MTDVLVVIGVGGMGEAIARRSGPGRHLLLADLDQELLERVSGSLGNEGFSVRSVPVDVSSRESVTGLAEVAAGLGPVRGFVHTAGLSPVQASTEAILRVDLLGVAHSLDEFARVVDAQGAGVVISSMAGTMIQGHLPGDLEAQLATTPTDELLGLEALQPGVVGDPGAAYAIAKRGNQLRVQAASLLWGNRGARVNSISPGVISTPMGLEELRGASGDFMRTLVAKSASRRLGTPADIANVAAFLLGPDASFVTGTDVLVDGGVVAALRSGALEEPEN